MGRFLLIQIMLACLLVATANKSVAGWITVIGEGTNATFAVENVAYLRKGNIRQFWAISNNPNKDMKSGVAFYETDCMKNTWRVLYMRLHREINGIGDILGEFNAPFDTPVNDAEKKVIRFVCSL
jgi:hypothetical protein